MFIGSTSSSWHVFGCFSSISQPVAFTIAKVGLEPKPKRPKLKPPYMAAERDKFIAIIYDDNESVRGQRRATEADVRRVGG